MVSETASKKRLLSPRKAIEAAYCKGIHCGVQMPDWRDNTELSEDDGSVDEHHPYWWGRLVAFNINALGV